MIPSYVREKPSLPTQSMSARWGDFDAFEVIYSGVKQGMTIQEIGESNQQHVGGPRTLYRCLTRLERRLNVQLVYRAKWSRDTRITPDGEQLHKYLHRINILRQEVEQEFQSQHPRLRVVTTSGVAVLAFSQIIAQRKEQQKPEIDVRYIEEETWEDAITCVESGFADIGVFTCPADAPIGQHVRSEKLTDPCQWPFLVSRKHPLAEQARKHAPVSVNDLRDERATIMPHYAPMLRAATGMRSLMLVPNYAYIRPLVERGVAISPGCEVIERLLGPTELVSIEVPSPLACSTVLLRAPHFPVVPSAQIGDLLDDLKVFFQSLHVNHD